MIIVKSYNVFLVVYFVSFKSQISGVIVILNLFGSEDCHSGRIEISTKFFFYLFFDVLNNHLSELSTIIWNGGLNFEMVRIDI